jgi:anti-anti-sigma regulatory factor
MNALAEATDLALPAEFGIYTVTEVKQRLAKALAATEGARGTVLTVAGDGVEQVDGAALRLLIVLALELRRRGMRLQLVAPSAPLLRAIARFGAGTTFGLSAPSLD